MHQLIRGNSRFFLQIGSDEFLEISGIDCDSVEDIHIQDFQGGEQGNIPFQRMVVSSGIGTAHYISEKNSNKDGNTLTLEWEQPKKHETTQDIRKELKKYHP